MAAGTWKDLTAGLDADDLAKLTAFRDYCRSLGADVDERVHSADVTYAITRAFASAYNKSHYLEVGIELTREVRRPKPRTSFATTKRVWMHRYSLRELSDFDDEIRALVREAYETVGPGFTRN
ncbi:MAG: DUF5655 domain-containing protein [Pseudolysinimonas sp.]